MITVGKPAIKPLLGLLIVSYPTAQYYGINYEVLEPLMKISKNNIEYVINILQKKDDNLEFRAAYVLWKIGLPAVEPLIGALRDKNYNDKFVVAVALGAIGNTRAIEPIAMVIKDSYDAEHYVYSNLSVLHRAGQLWADRHGYLIPVGIDFRISAPSWWNCPGDR